MTGRDLSAAEQAAAAPFCACCGGLTPGLFCEECIPHVASDDGQPYWERTFYFLNETVCPVEARDTERSVA